MEKRLTSVIGAGLPRMFAAVPITVMVRFAPPFGPKAPLAVAGRPDPSSSRGRAAEGAASIENT
jgi:hypothetical protein